MLALISQRHGTIREVTPAYRFRAITGDETRVAIEQEMETSPRRQPLKSLMKILIADDAPFFRLLVASAVRALGHETVVVENGVRACAALQQTHFSVVISDWMMPLMDGLELSRVVRAQPGGQYTCVILLTSLGGKANYLEAMNAGADDFMSKPFDAEQLAARLIVAERMLGLRQQVRQLEGLLPICAYCKKIRDEQDAWKPVEKFIAARTEATFSHGICPACMDEHFPTAAAGKAA